jgi:membrane fusion protein (multidrug efflux system)
MNEQTPPNQLPQTTGNQWVSSQDQSTSAPSQTGPGTQAATVPPISGQTLAPSVAPLRPRARIHRGLIRYVVIAAIAVVVVVWGYREVVARLTHVYEYDARITTDLVTVSSKREGQMIKLHVREGQFVEAGTVLAELDSRIPELEARAIEAQMLALESDRQRKLSSQTMEGQQTDSRIVTRNSMLVAAEAKGASLRAELSLARQDLVRVEELFRRKVISRSRLDAARASVGRLSSDVAEAVAQMQQARGAIAETEAERGEIEMIAQEISMLSHQTAALQAELDQKKVEIEEHNLVAPIAGVVDRLFIEGGEHVRQGQRLLMLHDPSAVWVEANVKETEVRNLKRGQHVNIAVDAFPDAEFTGSVERIGTATTAKFALLPTPNPSGNFTKITQRVPVRIALDRSSDPALVLAPGMMVEIEVDIRE